MVFRVVELGLVPVRWVVALSNSAAAFLNLKKTSAEDGESRERMDTARNGESAERW